MSLLSKRWQKIVLALGLLLGAGAGASALRAACSDGCPSSCPTHASPLSGCTITYDDKGTMLSASCSYNDGCTVTNAGGGAAEKGPRQKSM